jgi:hypothetical protein
VSFNNPIVTKCTKMPIENDFTLKINGWYFMMGNGNLGQKNLSKILLIFYQLRNCCPVFQQNLYDSVFDWKTNYLNKIVLNSTN